MFVYILSVVIISALLLIGYKYIHGSSETISKVEAVSLQNKFTSDMNSIRRDYGSFRKVNYPLKSNAELCLVDMNFKEEILKSELINFYPLIKDSIASKLNNNVFILSKLNFNSFFTGEIEIPHYPYFKCSKAINGKVGFGIEGKGDKVLILTDFMVSAQINPARKIELSSEDNMVKLEIPQGTTATADTVSIEIFEPELPTIDKKGSDIYKFQPAGTVFSTPIELSLKYNPISVGVCPKSLTFYQYNDDGTLKAQIPSKNSDCENRIATFEINSFSYGYISAEEDTTANFKRETTKCSDCGAGALNACDMEECLNLGNCEFIDKTLPFPNECRDKSLAQPGEEITCSDSSLIGDANGDGKITPADAQLITKVGLGQVSNPSNICCIDANKDNLVNSDDATLVFNFFTGNGKVFYVNQRCSMLNQPIPPSPDCNVGAGLFQPIPNPIQSNMINYPFVLEKIGEANKYLMFTGGFTAPGW